MAQAHRRLAERRRPEDRLLAGDDHRLATAGEDLLRWPRTRSRSAATSRRPPTTTSAGAYWESFDVDLDPTLSVLDGLLQAKNDQDGTLAVRCSCRAAICGSCGVKVNGQSTLACKTQLGEAADEAERIARASGSRPGRDRTRADGPTRITVEPMGNMPVIKDLVTDMESTHWEKYRRVTPWLLPTGPPPEREYIVPPEAMVDVTQSVACIQCGACVSACLSMEADPDFIGPAALAKAYRFVGDPRDGQTTERLYDLANDPHGIYDCTHCFSCIEACPKGVAPMNQIMRLRRLAGDDHDDQRRQQRPPPRAGLRQDHREEGHARRVAAAAGVLRPRDQGQADAERWPRSRACSSRSRPRSAGSAPARCARSRS